MLRIAAHKVRQDVIVRLDKGIGGGIAGIIHINAEVLKVSEASFGKANNHPAYAKRLGDWITLADGPAHSRVVEPIIDVPVVNLIPIEKGTDHIIGGWTL